MVAIDTPTPMDLHKIAKEQQEGNQQNQYDYQGAPDNLEELGYLSKGCGKGNGKSRYNCGDPRHFARDCLKGKGKGKGFPGGFPGKGC